MLDAQVSRSLPTPSSTDFATAHMLDRPDVARPHAGTERSVLPRQPRDLLADAGRDIARYAARSPPNDAYGSRVRGVRSCRIGRSCSRATTSPPARRDRERGRRATPRSTCSTRRTTRWCRRRNSSRVSLFGYCFRFLLARQRASLRQRSPCIARHFGARTREGQAAVHVDVQRARIVIFAVRQMAGRHAHASGTDCRSRCARSAHGKPSCPCPVIAPCPACASHGPRGQRALSIPPYSSFPSIYRTFG